MKDEDKSDKIYIYILIQGYNNGDKGHQVFDGLVRFDWAI